ncbi:acid ceramidase-like [Centruroides sculpturatus]|uniref:acid ceramidase-like n=1 Tax=Centruroides sculpturatus TaxID=218467 RepID=UPI000C6E880E|nr:acid ceramidase-like [Centruroides sculpturatus]
MNSFLSLCLFIGLCPLFVLTVVPPTGQCVKDAYPPPLKNKVPIYAINLDLPPELRWNKLIADKRKELNATINVIKNLTKSVFNGKFIWLVDHGLPLILKSLPEPYSTEIASIAKISKIPIGEIILYNIFYEIFTFCTSVIVQDIEGNLYHGRNLDFGIFMGWDAKNHTWLITEALQQTLAQLEFYKGNKLLYKSVGFAGYVGVITAIKPKHFTLTVNERFKLNGGYIGIIEWILGFHSSHWMGFLTRDVMEKSPNYTTAKHILARTELIAPVYFILGGNKKGEACIITRDRGTNKADILTMGNGWYVLQTNYDHWKNPPFFDDRRTPAIKCLNKMTQKNASFAGIFNVLSTQPNLNKLTAYTSLMEARTGKLETYLQYCDDPCWPW